MTELPLVSANPGLISSTGYCLFYEFRAPTTVREPKSGDWGLGVGMEGELVKILMNL